MRDAEANLAREATCGWSWLVEMDLSGDWPTGENEEGRRRRLVDWLVGAKGIPRWEKDSGGGEGFDGWDKLPRI